MKVGVVSDSHGNEKNLLLAAQHLVEDEKVETIIHLGDDCSDTELLKQFPVKIIKVPGVFSERYLDPKVPNRLIEKIKGWKVLITHTLASHYNDLPQDLVPEIILKEKKVRMVLYGHTHMPSLEHKEDILLINPGHLRSCDKKGHRPSYGLIEFEKDEVIARIFDLAENKEINCAKISR